LQGADSATMEAAMTRRALTILLCAAALTAVTGCGGSGGGNDQSASAAVQSYVDAQNHNDFAKVCDALSDQLRRQLGGSNCAGFIQEQSSGNPRRQLKVIGVTQNGDSATADLEITGESGSPVRVSVQLQRQNGDWRISGIGP
jgi:hypothetical protein